MVLGNASQTGGLTGYHQRADIGGTAGENDGQMRHVVRHERGDATRFDQMVSEHDGGVGLTSDRGLSTEPRALVQSHAGRAQAIGHGICVRLRKSVGHLQHNAALHRRWRDQCALDQAHELACRTPRCAQSDRSVLQRRLGDTSLQLAQQALLPR